MKFKILIISLLSLSANSCFSQNLDTAKAKCKTFVMADAGIGLPIGSFSTVSVMFNSYNPNVNSNNSVYGFSLGSGYGFAVPGVSSSISFISPIEDAGIWALEVNYNENPIALSDYFNYTSYTNENYIASGRFQLINNTDYRTFNIMPGIGFHLGKRKLSFEGLFLVGYLICQTPSISYSGSWAEEPAGSSRYASPIEYSGIWTEYSVNTGTICFGVSMDLRYSFTKRIFAVIKTLYTTGDLSYHENRQIIGYNGVYEYGSNASTDQVYHVLTLNAGLSYNIN